MKNITRVFIVLFLGILGFTFYYLDQMILSYISINLMAPFVLITTLIDDYKKRQKFSYLAIFVAVIICFQGYCAYRYIF